MKRYYLINALAGLLFLSFNGCVSKDLHDESNFCEAIEILRPTNVPAGDLTLFKITNLSGGLKNILLKQKFDSITLFKHNELKFNQLSTFVLIDTNTIQLAFTSNESSYIRDSMELVEFCNKKYSKSQLRIYFDGKVTKIKTNKNTTLNIQYLNVNEIDEAAKGQ
jgi:hypothetical protein